MKARAVTVLCVLFSVVQAVAVTGAREVTLTVHRSKKQQVIDNFGSSTGMRASHLAEHWPRQSVEQIARWLFSTEMDDEGNPCGIGLSAFRV